mmetsp:Transcript_22800/g.73083  ORF Transcript_22800/g.73083 Transcript_22800/m.73083 type:complete len:487 (+) Transcript_22800:89-1549(+)
MRALFCADALPTVAPLQRCTAPGAWPPSLTRRGWGRGWLVQEPLWARERDGSGPASEELGAGAREGRRRLLSRALPADRVLALCEEGVEGGLEGREAGARDVPPVLERGASRVEVVRDRLEGRDRARVELLTLAHVDRHADAAGLRVDAPRRLEQVVHALGHVDVEAGVRVREDHLREDRGELWRLALAFDPLPPLGAAHRRPLFEGVEQLLRDLLVLEHREQLLLPLCRVENPEPARRLALEHVRVEERLELVLVRARQRRVHRSADCKPPGSRREDGAEVVGDGAAHLVGHPPRARVAHPQVDAAAARVDAEDVLKPKVLSQRALQHTHRERHERPAAVARLEPLDVDLEEVVVGQVNVDDQLALLRLEELVLLVVRRRRGKDGSDVNLVWQLGEQVLLEAGLVLVRQVPDVHVVARCEGELAPLQKPRARVGQLRRAVAEPPAHGGRREDAVVVHAQQLRAEVLAGRRWRRLGARAGGWRRHR